MIVHLEGGWMASSRHDSNNPHQRTPREVLPPGPARDLVDRFRTLRRLRPLSIRLVAMRAGLSASYVSEVFNGVKAPRADAAARIAKALGADERSALDIRRLAEEQSELQQFHRRAERDGRGAGPTMSRTPGPEPDTRSKRGDTNPVVDGSTMPATHGSDLVLPATATIGDARTPMDAQIQRYAIDNPSGPRRYVAVVAGSLYRSRGADIWVNSENTEMIMSRPSEFSVSAVIRYWGARRDAAGRIVDDTIADELAERVGLLSSVAPGTAIVTGSGALAESHGVRHIVHVAAVSSEPGVGFRQVHNIAACVTNVLVEADRLARADPSLRTILFPLLGVGAGGGPVAPTVTATIDTVIAFLFSHPSTSLTDIQLLGFNAMEWHTLTAALAADQRLTRTTC